jgi:hypothetical protein
LKSSYFKFDFFSRRGYCLCQDGFYEKDGICKAELGEFVESENYCGTGIYKNGRCVCKNDQFSMPDMRRCLRCEFQLFLKKFSFQFYILAASGIQTSCTQPSQCSPYGAAFCPVEQPRRCQCHEYAKYNEITELCELKKGVVGEYCEKSEDCKIENTNCTHKNTCECKANFIAQNEIECKPGVGGECETTDECAFENAECKVETLDETKKCRCKEDFVSVENACFEKGLLLR